MPRGGDYSDGPTVQSDNAIEAGENKIAGAASGSTSEVDRSGKAAPLPEGVEEMKDGNEKRESEESEKSEDVDGSAR